MSEARKIPQRSLVKSLAKPENNNKKKLSQTRNKNQRSWEKPLARPATRKTTPPGRNQSEARENPQRSQETKPERIHGNKNISETRGTSPAKTFKIPSDARKHPQRNHAKCKAKPDKNIQRSQEQSLAKPGNIPSEARKNQQRRQDKSRAKLGRKI